MLDGLMLTVTIDRCSDVMGADSVKKGLRPMSPSEVRYPDPSHRLLLEVVSGATVDRGGQRLVAGHTSYR